MHGRTWRLIWGKTKSSHSSRCASSQRLCMQVQEMFSKVAGVIEVSREKDMRGGGVRLARTEAEYQQVKLLQRQVLYYDLL